MSFLHAINPHKFAPKTECKMNIIQQPDMLSLSMNLKNFIIGSSRQTTFTLKAGDKELVSQVYAPDENGVMEIDIHEIVHSFLSYSLKDIGEVYQQTNLVADFTAVITPPKSPFALSALEWTA